MVANGPCVLCQGRCSCIPLWSARQCSDSHFRVFPDRPMYTLGQSEQRISYTPLPPPSPLVQGPWGEPVGGVECEVGRKPPCCPVAWGPFLLPWTTHWCRARSGWSLVAFGHPLFAWVSCCLSACGWNLVVGSLCLSAPSWFSSWPLTPHYSIIMC